MEVDNLINLYKKDETTFEHNGLGSLDKNILNPEINWKDNGAFTLEFKYPLFAKHGFEIENSSIVRANDPEGTNLFFVYKITPSMGYVTVLCYQISYKLAFNSINDTNIVNKSGQNALTQMSAVTQYPHSFVFSSDIQITATSRVVRKNPIEFLLDTGLDNSFVNRWGGHIVRHNFNIAMNSAYGSNKGYTIRHKKDLKGYEAEFDESTVITRIRPVGYDGLLLPELYVDSSLINNYVEPRIQQIEYSNVKVKTKDSDEEGFSTKELAYAELRRLANLEFSKNKVDVPSFSCKVEFVNLKDTQEYKDLKSLKQILAGDIVKVIHSEDNFNIEAQMVEYKWNPLNQSYISITLGNYTKSFTSTVSKVSSLQTNLSQIAQTAESAWSAANGKNAVYSLTYKPAITKSSTEGDLLYLKNGDKIEMWILEKVNGELQWVLQVSDATSEELKAQIAQAKADIDDAVDSANSAVDKANASVTAIQANTQLITDVRNIANNAKTQANTAATNAQTAIANAQTALEKANGVSSKQTTIETNIDTINGTLSSKANTTDVNALKGRVSTAESSITQNANDIKLKANKTDVNTIGGKVSSLESNFTVQSGQITALNTKTDGQTTQIGSLQSSYNGLISTVASVGNSLSQNNLVYNSTLQSGSDGWTLHNGFTQSSAINISGNYIINFSLSDNPSSTWYFARSRQVPIGIWKEYAYAANFMRRTDIPNNGVFMFGVEGFDANGNRVEFKTVNTHSQLTDDKWIKLSDMYEFTNPDVKTVCFTLATNGFGHYIACQPILVNDSKVGNFVPDGMDKGQITQMVQDLDGFKTTVANTYADKSTVASQINQSATAITSNVQTWTNNKLTSYSTTQQTTDSITNAVANKADKSQITQLSNQITSTVSQISNNSNLFSIKKMKVSTAYHPDYTTFLLVEIATDIGATYTASSDHPSQNLWFIPANNSNIGAATYRVYSGKTVAFVATSSKSYVAIRDTATQSQLSNETYHLKVERGISATDWSPSAQDSATQSQVTQLSDNINLRVSKGDVTSQINIEAGRTLIDTKQLLLNADTVKFSGSAFIPNSVIQNLSADKITAGTINAANVNIINLNAANITTGTLTGTNLSMNLNTGAVQFQKGYIAGNNNKIRFDLDNNYFQSLDKLNNGFIVKDGTFTFYQSIFGTTGKKIGVLLGDMIADGGGIILLGEGGASLTSKKYGSSVDVGTAGLGTGNDVNITGNTHIWNDLGVLGKKNAIHITRDGIRATPAYETAESYLGDIGGNYTRENCEVWVDIEKLFSDTVNTDIAYHVFLQAYDDAHFWVAEFKPDKFLIKSDKPMARFSWEIKAKRRGYENDRLVIQEGFDNKTLLEAQSKGIFKGDGENE